MMRLTPMVKNILIINVAIFLIQSLLFQNLPNLLGLRVIFADDFRPYQFVTYMWIHGDMGHVFSNMFAVFIFGPMLENVWGSKRFLTFYLMCGIGAGVLFGVADYIEKIDLKHDKEAYLDDPTPDRFEKYILEHRWYGYNKHRLAEFAIEYQENANNPGFKQQASEIVKNIYDKLSNVPMVGASGAVFGILMAFGMLFPNTKLFLLFPPIPLKAKYLVLGYGLLELFAELERTPGDNVAHLAHLSGMLIAYLILKYWQRHTHRFY